MLPEPVKPDDAEPLNSSIATLCFVIAKARQFAVKVDPPTPDEASNPADDGGREVLEDLPSDSVQEELLGALAAMNEDELFETLALVWLGRGDFDRSEWQTALAQARDALDDATPRYLLGLPLLGDYLEEGLSMLGYSCEDYEVDRL